MDLYTALSLDNKNPKEMQKDLKLLAEHIYTFDVFYPNYPNTFLYLLEKYKLDREKTLSKIDLQEVISVIEWFVNYLEEDY